MSKPNNSALKTILVTGANGFVGTALCEALSTQGFKVKAAVRKDASQMSSNVVSVGEINSDTDWTGALSGVDTVIHLAARVHVMN